MKQAGPLITLLAPVIGHFKVGLELFVARGDASIQAIKTAGGRIMLDLKLHDIPETVKRAAQAAASKGDHIDFITAHAAGGKEMLKAAVEGAHNGNPNTDILAITVLTSEDLAVLEETGVTDVSVMAVVKRRALMAQEAGCCGVVASAQEAGELRKLLGPDMLIIVPGIRNPDGDAADQKRIGTPEAAIGDGASALVVGRPIRDAEDPRAAAEGFVAQIAAKLATMEQGAQS
ncbi:orotidine-5'-phosphate decarboxylase [Candidatus Uhrbacteria bacterium]|nr:orotidine-5'-phosphate decarboxylase [Candidatus Uhrbacteria bacterium]